MIGMALIIVAPILAVALFLVILEYADDDRFVIYGAVFLGAGAYWMINVGRRMRAVDGWELLRSDPRPPVVYLRPFQEDQRRRYHDPVGDRQGGENAGPNSSTQATREPKIARQITRIGPFVAVGKPGDSLAPLGAARIYVSDDEWQETVTSLVRRAAAVVLQPEASPGTFWEVDLVGQIVDMRRVLLLVPDPVLRPLGFARVRELIAQALSVSLPLPGEGVACDAFMFDALGRPLPIVFKSSKALKPFVQQVLLVNGKREGAL
jgi:hypothetical protein